jgi:hypothetical protein
MWNAPQVNEVWREVKSQRLCVIERETQIGRFQLIEICGGDGPPSPMGYPQPNWSTEDLIKHWRYYPMPASICPLCGSENLILRQELRPYSPMQKHVCEMCPYHAFILMHSGGARSYENVVDALHTTILKSSTYLTLLEVNLEDLKGFHGVQGNPKVSTLKDYRGNTDLGILGVPIVSFSHVPVGVIRLSSLGSAKYRPVEPYEAPVTFWSRLKEASI